MQVKICNSVIETSRYRKKKKKKTKSSKVHSKPLKISTGHLHQALVLHKCNFCPKKFNTPEHLQRHIVMSHTKSKPFKCSLCKMGKT